MTPTKNAPAVHLGRISISRGHRTVIKDLSLTVAHGEWLNIVGPNGEGKSTLLQAVAGIIPWHPALGAAPKGESHARIFGRDVTTSAKVRSTLVCLCPQRPVIPEGLHVRSYVELGRTPYQGLLGRTSAEDVRVVEEVMDRLDVSRYATRTLKELSGGELHRVVLAKALAQQPQLLLLDEPTAALDIGRAQQVLGLVNTLRSETGMTVLTAIHDLTLAGCYGDAVAALKNGTVAFAGKARDVITPANIKLVYGATAQVLDGPDGPIVAPRRTCA